MAQTEMDRLLAFIAFRAASRAEAKEPASKIPSLPSGLNKVKGQNVLRSALLYSRLVALGSLASVALPSNQAMGVYHLVNPSRRGHLYFAE
jgi:hypothetical protein